MLNEIVDIEELTTADSVGEANRLLQEGWQLLGFHPAPPTAESSFGTSTTIFVLARLIEYDEEELDVELEEFESQPS
jgi:hypothetical protein